MGRKKMIEDDVLIALIGDYYIKECGGNAANLTNTKVAEYVATHGYPEFSARLLRRNSAAQEHMEELRAQGDSEISTLVTYKPIDINELLAGKPSEAKLRRILTDLNGYHQQIVSKAVAVFDKHDDLVRNLVTAEEKAAALQAETEEQAETIRALKREKAEIKKQLAALEKELHSHVRPEVAKEVLRECGILKGEPSKIVEDTAVIKPDNIVSIRDSLLSLMEGGVKDES